MDRKTLQKARRALDETQPGRGRMFCYATYGGKQLLEVSRFHCADTSAEIVVEEKLRLTMRRQLRGMLARDHQGAGCSGLFYVVDGVPTFRVCVRQRLTTRQLTAALSPVAERLGVSGMVVIKDRRS